LDHLEVASCWKLGLESGGRVPIFGQTHFHDSVVKSIFKRETTYVWYHFDWSNPTFLDKTNKTKAILFTVSIWKKDPNLFVKSPGVLLVSSPFFVASKVSQLPTLRVAAPRSRDLLGVP
jgi:hypothetical protein